MFSTIKSRISRGRDIKVLEESTLVYDEEQPFIYDTEPYSTYLFIFQNEQFTVYAVSMQKAIEHVEMLKGGSEEIKKERYAVINLTNDPEWHSANINQSKRNNVVNHILDSLFNV